MDLSVSGLASGWDWKTVVEQLIEVERTPQVRLRGDQSKIAQKNAAYGYLKTQLSSLQTKLKALNESSLYDSRGATNTDDSVAVASTANGATPGTYAFKIYQTATSAVLNGQSDVGRALGDSTTSLEDAGFATAVTAGTFSINGRKVTIGSTTESLDTVFENIRNATTTSDGSYVEATYDTDNDAIVLTSRLSDGSRSGQPIVLGAPGDTSNFLAAAKLSYNNSDQVPTLPAERLGAIKVSSTLENANFAQAITGGSSGSFKINGVTIAYDTANDTVAHVLTRINESGAGVTATYDSVNDRFSLANNATGDNGVALEDGEGSNFLAAAGLLSGTLSRGTNLIYSVNNGSQRTSTSNTIDEASSGIKGLTLTALTAGSDLLNPATTTVTVESNTDDLRTAVTSFLSEYNKTQTLIDNYTAIETSASGSVSSGVLSSLQDVTEIATALRSKSFSAITGMSGSITSLASLGIQTSGDDNSLTLQDSAALDDALSDNLDAVKSLFTQDSTGLVARLGGYLEKVAGDDGSLATTQANLTKQSTEIDTKIADMERVVQQQQQTLTASFVAMETAQAKIQQQLTYLTKNFGS